MDSKVSSGRLSSYLTATRPVLKIFKMAGYFPDSPRIFKETSFCPFYRPSSDLYTKSKERNYTIIYKTLDLSISGNSMGLEFDI